MGKRIIQLFKACGFKLKVAEDMNGWLAYHAIFIACIAAALQKTRFNAKELSNHDPLLRLMCRAIEEGFSVLHAQGKSGLPKNLAILHNPWLRPVAVAYWRRTMRTKGEAYFGAHIGRAKDEMQMLRSWALDQLRGAESARHLRTLLNE
jgi:ketopantoate reductase